MKDLIGLVAPSGPHDLLKTVFLEHRSHRHHQLCLVVLHNHHAGPSKTSLFKESQHGNYLHRQLIPDQALCKPRFVYTDHDNEGGKCDSTCKAVMAAIAGMSITSFLCIFTYHSNIEGNGRLLVLLDFLSHGAFNDVGFGDGRCT